MEGIKIEVTGNIARVIERPQKITAGTVGLPIEFTFDGQWDGLSKTAVFRVRHTKKIVESLETETTVPWELLDKPGAWLSVGVYGMNADGSVVIPTVWANVAVIKEGADPDGDPGIDPELPVWQKLLNDMGDLQDLNTEDNGDLVEAINEAHRIARAGGVDTDTTLSEEGKAADSKATGEALEDVRTSVDEKLPLAGGEMTGSISMGGNSITGLAAPAEDADVATKEYVDSKCKSIPGLIYPFAGEVGIDKIPDGFLLCDGAPVSRTDYKALFDVIGTTYGPGDGKSTFNVPNLQTRVPVGAGGEYKLGDTGGEETHELTEKELASHKHDLLLRESTKVGSSVSYLVIGTDGSYANGYRGDTKVAGGDSDKPISYDEQGNVTAYEVTPHNNMQPYTVVNYIITTGKGAMVEITGRASGGGDDASVIDDGIVSLDKTWSSQKIADEIANVPSGGGGDSPVIITSFGDYTNLAEYIKNGMDDNSAVICYTNKKLTEGFPDTSSLPGYPLYWCIEIHKSNGSSAEINARASNQFSTMQAYTHRWNGMYTGSGIDWKQIELYTGESEIDDSISSAEKTWSSQKIAEEIADGIAGALSGGDGGDASVVAQGTTNGWLWRKWSNGVAECWKAVTCSTVSANVVYAHETMPFDIISNRTVQVTQSDVSFGGPSTEIAKFTIAWVPGGGNMLRIFAQKTDNYATGATVSASVYVCGTYQ